MPHRIEIKEFPSFFILLFHAILNDYFVGSLNNNNNKKIVVHVNFLSRHEFQRAHFLKKKKKMINQRFSIIKHLVVFDTQRVKRQQQKNTVDKERMYRYLFFLLLFYYYVLKVRKKKINFHSWPRFNDVSSSWFYLLDYGSNIPSIDR